jgi:hypothetical protein
MMLNVTGDLGGAAWTKNSLETIES